MLSLRLTLLVCAAAALTAGCGASGAAAPAAPARAVSTSPSASAPVPPATAKGARRTAATYFALNSAGQYAALYPLLAQAARRKVGRHTWIAVHNGCPAASKGLADKIKHVTLAGHTAVITITVDGALSKLGSATEVFKYHHGKWGYSPSDLGLYQHGSVAADVAAAKAAGLCAS
jgi:hypothetical protein